MVTSQTTQWANIGLNTQPNLVDMKGMNLLNKPATSLISITFILLFGMLSQSVVYAKVYKWTDANGQVHYGEQPGNTNAETVTIRQNETTKPRPIKKVDKDSEDETSAAKEPEMVEVKIPAKEKRQLCQQAKGDVEAINSRGRMREINAKGEYIYLSEEQKQARISAAKKRIKKYCR
jgi:hypothetical protein